MGEKVEEVAKALWEDMSQLLAKGVGPLPAWDSSEAEGRGKADCINAARVAIMAMRIPNKDMIQAGANVVNTDDNARETWIEMVDEVLK